MEILLQDILTEFVRIIYNSATCINYKKNVLIRAIYCVENIASIPKNKEWLNNWKFPTNSQ